MKRRVYRCKKCGREVVGQGALAHLRSHRLATREQKLDDVRDQLELIEETEIANPVAVGRKRKLERLRPEIIGKKAPANVPLHVDELPVVRGAGPRRITVMPNFEVVTDGERIGIVEWMRDADHS